MTKAQMFKARHPSPANPLRWCFEDRRTGRIVIGQSPNLPMQLCLVGFVAEHLGRAGGKTATVGRGAKIVGFSAWALAEIATGVNPWRRALGTVAALGGLALARRRS